ncbi:MAG: hypothetical protein ACT4PP_00260 [Sporichthyaceae bacterium]
MRAPTSRLAIAAAALGLVCGACGTDAEQAQPTVPVAAVAAAGTPSPAGHGSDTTPGGHGAAGDVLAGLVEHLPGETDHSAGQSTGPRKDIAEIRRVIVDHYADPGCAELTDNAERQFGYGPGPECDRIIDERNTPRKVEVGAVQVDGDEATAEVENETFVMVRPGKRWLIDGVR